MSRLPRLTAKQIVSILERRGFRLARQSGSHRIFKNTEDQRATVPFHDNKILHPKVLKNIIKDAGIEPEELKQ